MAKNIHPLALVTGAAHRLGREFALALARQGYAIALHFHDSAKKANETADEIKSFNIPVYLFQADLTKEADILSLFSNLDNLANPLKVVVNSAGVIQRGDIRSLSVEDFDATIALNLRAPFLCAQQSFTRMTSGGLIVNISDIGANKAWTGFPMYVVSKAGLESLTRVLARAFAPSVRVNAIAPGLVIPDDGTSEEDWQRLTNRVPLRRVASPAEVYSALEYLLKNEYITGQTITVDGGYSLL